MMKSLILSLVVICTVVSAQHNGECNSRGVTINPYNSTFFADFRDEITLSIFFTNYGNDSEFNLVGLVSEARNVSTNETQEFIGTLPLEGHPSMILGRTVETFFFMDKEEDVRTCNFSFYVRPSRKSAFQSRSLSDNSTETEDDKTEPQISLDVGGDYCHKHDKKETTRNQTTCKATVWTLKGSVQDNDTGLLGVEIKPIGYSLPTIISGTNETVEFLTNVTCCHTEVSVQAVDVAGNIAVAKYALSFGNPHFDYFAVFAVNCLLVLVRVFMA